MNTQPKEITYYQTREGVVPFREWFAALRDRAAQMRIDARLARLRSGNPGDVEAVGGGISELRIDYGPGYPGLSSDGRNDDGHSALRWRQANTSRQHQTSKEILGGLSTACP